MIEPERLEAAAKAAYEVQTRRARQLLPEFADAPFTTWEEMEPAHREVWRETLVAGMATYRDARPEFSGELVDSLSLVTGALRILLGNDEVVEGLNKVIINPDEPPGDRYTATHIIECALTAWADFTNKHGLQDL